MFLNLVGWEHFNISVIEVCSPEEQGARENYYLQTYLPLLNTTFSSSFSESAIYKNLKSKLAMLKPSSELSAAKWKRTPVYVYEIENNCIKKSYVKYDKIMTACYEQKIAWATLTMLRDTNRCHLEESYTTVVQFKILI